MSNALKRDVPAGAAVVIVALALLASVVTGREQTSAPPVAAPAAERPAASSVVEAIDVSRLARERRESPGQDLFASPAPAPASIPSAAVIEPPRAPMAPPLPYSYLGQMKKGDRLIVYLLKGQELLLAESGQALDGSYKIDAVTESAVTFLYRPLDTRQVLTIPSRAH